MLKSRKKSQSTNGFYTKLGILTKEVAVGVNFLNEVLDEF